MKGDIVGFCCNYTANVPAEVLKEAGLVPETLRIRRLPCTGKLEVAAIMDALADGAEGVFVAGCRVDECHNLTGSQRASKRVAYAKEMLKELDLDPGRVEMIFVPRGEAGPIIQAAREMKTRIAGMDDAMTRALESEGAEQSK